MSIGKFLLNRENLEFVGKNSFKFGRERIISEGLCYFEKTPEEVDQIVKNLDYMGMGSSGKALDDVLEGISIHYFEKLFVLTKSFEMHWIAKNRIELDENFKMIREAKSSGIPVFVAQSHFGASYFMGITFMVNGLDIASVGKFPEPVGSMIVNGSNAISLKFGTGKTKLINVADPSTDVPYEMLSTLMRGGILSNVFDENNQFCHPMELMGKKVMGGSGMDIFLKKYTDEKILVVTPFIVRTGDDTYRFELERHYLAKGNIIQSFYHSLEKRILANPAQWYFIHELHEAIPE